MSNEEFILSFDMIFMANDRIKHMKSENSGHKELHFSENIAVKATSRTIRLGDIEHITLGVKWRDTIHPAYPFFVAKNDNKYTLLNSDDPRLLDILCVYDADTMLDVFVVCPSQKDLVEFISNKLFPHLSGKLSFKDFFQETCSNNKYIKILTDNFLVTRSKAGAKVPFNIESFREFLGNPVSSATLNRLVRNRQKSRPTFTPPTQIPVQKRNDTKTDKQPNSRHADQTMAGSKQPTLQMAMPFDDTSGQASEKSLVGNTGSTEETTSFDSGLDAFLATLKRSDSIQPNPETDFEVFNLSLADFLGILSSKDSAQPLLDRDARQYLIWQLKENPIYQYTWSEHKVKNYEFEQLLDNLDFIPPHVAEHLLFTINSYPPNSEAYSQLVSGVEVMVDNSLRAAEELYNSHSF